ncbi:MAG: hypothetical protein WBB69_01590 [Anaerolineales bacterium]
MYDPADAKEMLKNPNRGGSTSLIRFKFGSVGDNWVPVSGDWKDDDLTTIGLFGPDVSYKYLKPSFVSGWGQYSLIA